MIDDGRPFDPTAARAAPDRADLALATPGGRGLRAVHALAKRLDYRREDRRNRVQVLVAYG